MPFTGGWPAAAELGAGSTLMRQGGSFVDLTQRLN